MLPHSRCITPRALLVLSLVMITMLIFMFQFRHHIDYFGPTSTENKERPYSPNETGSKWTSMFQSHPEAQNKEHRVLSLEEAQQLCSDANTTVDEKFQQRKVYDLFILGSELDWLEIRLHELADYVDYFVIVESARTFTFHQKPLHLKENYARFQQFAHKIIYRTLDFEGLERNSTWDREVFQRNALFTAVFPGLLGDQAPEENDVLIVSDLDEVPHPKTIDLLRTCQYPDKVSLQSRFYYYSFQWERENDFWSYPHATKFKGFQNTILPQALRRSGTAEMQILNSSWHCSSCFKTIADIQHKIESFSHTEYDKPDFKDPEKIVYRVRNGLDLFDRKHLKYVRVDDNRDVPKYVLENKDAFAYLLDRSPEDANFVDYFIEAGGG